jgi:hypothetical protein
MKPILLFFLLLTLCPLSMLQARGDTLFLNTPVKDTLALHACLKVFKDGSMKMNAEEVSRQVFQPLSSFTKFKVEKGENSWFRFTVRNNTPDSLDLLLWNTESSSSELYTLDNEGRSREIGKSGSVRSYTELSFKDSYRYVWLHLPPQHTQTCLLRVEEFLESQNVDNLYLMPPEMAITPEYVRKRSNWRQFFFLFFGILTAFSILSFGQFLINKNRAYLFYGFYLFACILLNAKQIQWLFGQEPHSLLSNYRYLVIYSESLFSYLMIITYLLFVRQFLSFKATVPWANRIVTYAIWLCTALIAVDLLLRLYPGYAHSFALFVKVREVLFAIFYLMIFFILTRLEDPLYRYVFVGSILMMLPFTFIAINHGEWFYKKSETISTPYYNFYDIGKVMIPVYTSRIGILLEILCFYLGLSHLSRIYRERSEYYELIVQQQQEAIDALQSTSPAAAPPSPNLTIRNRRGYEKIALSDILYCTAESNMCALHLKNGKQKIVSRTLKDVLAELPQPPFQRIHRSHAIHLSALLGFETKPKGGTALLLKDIALPVSQQYKTILIDHLTGQINEAG